MMEYEDTIAPKTQTRDLVGDESYAATYYISKFSSEVRALLSEVPKAFSDNSRSSLALSKLRSEDFQPGQAKIFLEEVLDDLLLTGIEDERLSAVLRALELTEDYLSNVSSLAYQVSRPQPSSPTLISMQADPHATPALTIKPQMPGFVLDEIQELFDSLISSSNIIAMDSVDSNEFGDQLECSVTLSYETVPHLTDQDISWLEESLAEKDWIKSRSLMCRHRRWLQKNKLGSLPPERHWFLHMKHVLVLAKEIIRSENLHLIDLDGTALPNYNSSSDLVFLDSDNNVYLVDVTGSLEAYDKLENMMAQAFQVRHIAIKKAYFVVLRINETEPLTADLPSHNFELVPEENFLTHERAVINLSKITRAADQETLLLSRLQLREMIWPCLDGAGLLSENSSNFEQMPKFRAWVASLKELQDPIKVESALNCSSRANLERVLPKTDDPGFLRGLSGFKFRDSATQRSRFPPRPVPFTIQANPACLETGQLPPLARALCSMKLGFINATWEPGTFLRILPNGDLVRIMATDYLNKWIDERQHIGEFKERETLAIARIRAEDLRYYVPKTPYVTKYTQGKYDLKDLKHLNLSYVEISESFDYREETICTGEFQIKINELVLADDNFIKYLLRKDKRFQVSKKRQWVSYNSAPELLSMSEEIFKHEEWSKLWSLPSPWEASAYLNASHSMFRRLTSLVINKTMPSLHLSNVSDLKMLCDKNLWAMEFLTEMSQAQSVKLRRKPLPNLAYVLLSDTFGSGRMVFSSGKQGHFETAWYIDFGFSSEHEILMRSREFRISQISTKLSTSMPASSTGLEGLMIREDTPDLCGYQSLFKSMDKHHLEWDLTLIYKAVAMRMYLLEKRRKLYNSGISKDLFQEEMALSISFLTSNSQQFSVISSAWRYLHQGLGSFDFEPEPILKKAQSCRIKCVEEASFLLRMVLVFNLNLYQRSILGINSIRSAEKETFTATPCTVWPSNDANLNVSLYSISNQLNVDKQWRLDSEALCVMNAMKQFHKEQQTLRRKDNYYQGATPMVIDAMITSQSLAEFMNRLKDHAAEETAYISSIVSQDDATEYTNSILYEFLCHLSRLIEFGKPNSSTYSIGEPMTTLMTLKGSLVLDRLKEHKQTMAKRKAVAVATLLRRVNSDNYALNELDLRDTSAKAFGDISMDVQQLMMRLMKARVWERVDSVCQYSEKDAPGKDREISTLSVEFGVMCLYLEKRFQSLSSSLEGDMLTEPEKEKRIMKVIKEAIAERDQRPETTLFYVNQDKSQYASNRKVSSMLLTSLLFSGDDFEFEVAKAALLMSTRKLVSYPHLLVSASEEHSLTAHFSDLEKIAKGHSLVKLLTLEREGQSAYIKSLIAQQMSEGNVYGPKGSTWLPLREGMPGQGIFTTISSISHALMQSELATYLQSRHNWSMRSLVTSDDSLSIFVIPSNHTTHVKANLKKFIMKVNSLAGLLENLSKMTISPQRGEMNAFFVLKGEPISNELKYLMASVSLESSGNFWDDLQKAVTKSLDLMRTGASASLCNLTAVLNVDLVMKAYRMWSVYRTNTVLSLGSHKVYTGLRWLVPPESLGLPVIDPFSYMLSEIGPRVCNLRSHSLTKEQEISYARFLLMSRLNASKADQSSKLLDRDDPWTASIEGEKYQMPAAKLPPNVSGIIGSLWRPKKTYKLLSQIGDFGASVLRSYSNNSLSLVDNISRFRGKVGDLLRKGDGSRDVLSQFTEITHAEGFRSLAISENSFLPKEYKKLHFSMNELKDLLASDSFLSNCLDNFKAALNSKIEVPSKLIPLLDPLIEEVSQAFKLSSYLWSASLMKDGSSANEVEWLREGDAERSIGNYLLSFKKSSEKTLEVDINLIKAELWSKYLSPDSDFGFDAELRLLDIQPRGEHNYHETTFLVEDALERIKSLFSSNNKVLCRLPLRTLSKDQKKAFWLRHNALNGHVLKVDPSAVSCLTNFSSRRQLLDSVQASTPVPELEFDRVPDLRDHESRPHDSRLENITLSKYLLRDQEPADVGVLSTAAKAKFFKVSKAELSELLSGCKIGKWSGSHSIRMKLVSKRTESSGSTSSTRHEFKVYLYHPNVYFTLVVFDSNGLLAPAHSQEHKLHCKRLLKLKSVEKDTLYVHWLRDSTVLQIDTMVGFHLLSAPGLILVQESSGGPSSSILFKGASVKSSSLRVRKPRWKDPPSNISDFDSMYMIRNLKEALEKCTDLESKYFAFKTLTRYISSNFVDGPIGTLIRVQKQAKLDVVPLIDAYDPDRASSELVTSFQEDIWSLVNMARSKATQYNMLTSHPLYRGVSQLYLKLAQDAQLRSKSDMSVLFVPVMSLSGAWSQDNEFVWKENEALTKEELVALDQDAQIAEAQQVILFFKDFIEKQNRVVSDSQLEPGESGGPMEILEENHKEEATLEGQEAALLEELKRLSGIDDLYFTDG